MGFPSLVLLSKKSTRFGVCVCLAIGLHIWILVGWKFPSPLILLDAGVDGAVEVSLVESPNTAPESLPIAPQTISPEPVVVQTESVPPLEDPDEVPSLKMTVPEAMPQPDVSRIAMSRPVIKLESPVSRSSKPAVAQKPRPLTSGVARSVSAMAEATSFQKIGKPDYSTKPSAVYPSESRAAGEQGTVTLRITVDARGRPRDVVVLVSSGFPRLDRAAVQGGWRCRIRNAKSGAQFDAPLRFDLRH